VNGGELINVYAYDIAKLPNWQQQIWVGHNIAPDGPVSSELLDSQVKARPASTKAPEAQFARLLSELDYEFQSVYGGPLFRSHDNREIVLGRVHRFRAIEGGGLLALAKDVARLTADSIDIALLRKEIKPPPDASMGSLKLLQAFLSQKTDAESARSAMTPLVGIYELRLGDAHLPSEKIRDAYQLLHIRPESKPLHQATTLLDEACSSLSTILALVR
jgi:hypothetical protein